MKICLVYFEKRFHLYRRAAHALALLLIYTSSKVSNKAKETEGANSTIKQQLSVKMDRFWSSFDNKVKFQRAFIKWMASNGQSDVLVYLGGANTEDITSCIQVWRGETIRVPPLKNDHEEADDRISVVLKR